MYRNIYGADRFQFLGKSFSPEMEVEMISHMQTVNVAVAAVDVDSVYRARICKLPRQRDPDQYKDRAGIYVREAHVVSCGW